MKALRTDDLISIEEYDRQRESFRASIIALKQRRRVSVGPLITSYLKTGIRSGFKSRK
ncbi:MAG: DUF3501 family protein [Nitrospiraceae bacterium]|nr:DUF3501 family protein [Nitrospiraceae bacterium]